MEQVWVMIRAQQARDRMLRLLDSGNLAEALGKKYYLDGLVDKMKAFVQQYGGSLTVAMYDCIVMQIPFSAAEQLPSITEGYKEALNGQICIGVGLTFVESAKACKKSASTGDIELYDNSTGSFDKSEARRISNPNVTLPNNVFSPTSPDDDYYQPQAPDDVVMPLNAEEAMQIETQYIQGLIGQMNPQQSSQQSPAEAPPQGEGQDQNTMDLLNMLSQQGAQPDAQQEGQSGESSDGGGDKQQAEEELEGQVEEAEQDAEAQHNDKLVSALQNVGSQIPQLMELADKNPDAFKQSINMINKLIAFAKQKPKDQVKKMEGLITQCEDLTKRFEQRTVNRGPNASANLDLPAGSRKGHYKKVIVNGKEVWRSFKTGQVKDDEDGSDISVRRYNAKQNQRQQQ